MFASARNRFPINSCVSESGSRPAPIFGRREHFNTVYICLDDALRIQTANWGAPPEHRNERRAKLQILVLHGTTRELLTKFGASVHGRRPPKPANLRDHALERLAHQSDLTKPNLPTRKRPSGLQHHPTCGTSHGRDLTSGKFAPEFDRSEFSERTAYPSSLRKSRNEAPGSH